MSTEYTVNGPEDLREIGQLVLANWEPGQVILLSGELGSGKTTFTQILAQQLGVTIPVTSPTFTIAGEYPVSEHPTIHRLVHLDLYRLPDNQAGQDLVVRELLSQTDQLDTLVVIEWPEKLGADQPARAQRLYFQHGSQPTQRVVRVE
jgi:tRNA threonylcarbamoyladenosine biosynthesis protein TsaE